MNTVYTGEQVRLRPFKDAAEYQWLMAHEALEPNAHWGIWYYPQAEARKDFEKNGLLLTDGYSAFAVEHLASGECIGYEEYGGYKPGRPSDWVGTFIRKEFRRQGLGVEAKRLNLCHLFESFPLNVVYADTTATHKPAQRGLELCGMKRCGVRRKAHYYKGRFVDIPQYYILRSEWEQLAYRHKVKRGL
ncbi:GNAT family N-acetyltransferase [bacterium]|nr:GNAT family N-acetyltransferase [bacterium]